MEACADALAAVAVEARQIGARRLLLAAHWADLHAPDTDRRSQGRPGGSDGTPRVSQFCADELGCLLGMTSISAAPLLRDALDLRHRHPRTWALLLAGDIEDWRARKLAHATARAELTLQQAQWVDSETAEGLATLPFSRAMARVEAKIIAADPEAHEARRQAALERRYVSATRTNPAGVRTLIAQTGAGDVARLLAMVHHLADLLERGGDNDLVDVRRAKALGILANPALACVLLAKAHVVPNAPQPDAPDVEFEPTPASTAQLAAELGRTLLELGPGAIDRLRPRSTVYVHLSVEALGSVAGGTTAPEIARVEGHGPVGLAELLSWLGTDRLTVRPVVDPWDQVPVDSYEIPHRHREAMLHRQPVEVFPYGVTPARGCDLDHTEPYRDSGPTTPDHLGPLSRHHHRAKTFGGFTLHQPLPGMYLWRIPSGRWFQVDHTGTRALGRQEPEILRQRRGRVDLVWAA